MVVRDIDVLKAIAARTSCSVYLSVPSVDEDAWRRLEPGTAPPLQRLRAVRALADAGIHCGVLMAPLVPGVTTRASLVEATMKAAADHGARSVGAMVLHLEGGTRTHFMRVLAREYPHLVAGYERLYTGKYAAPGYADEVQKMVGLLKAKYGVSAGAARESRPTPTATADARTDSRARQMPMRLRAIARPAELKRPPTRGQARGSPPALAIRRCSSTASSAVRGTMRAISTCSCAACAPSPIAPRPSSVGTPSAAVKLPSEPPPVPPSAIDLAELGRRGLAPARRAPRPRPSAPSAAARSRPTPPAARRANAA